MSEITFGDLYSDCFDINTSIEDCEKVKKVKIVPRKMIEMIIEKYKGIIPVLNDCIEKNKIDGVGSSMEIGMRVVAEDAVEYATELLKLFEGESDDKKNIEEKT